jgi:hypothetical protein
MDGKVMEDIFSTKFWNKNPVRYIDSYDPLVRKEYMHVSPSVYHEDMLKRLRSLGYVQ